MIIVLFGLTGVGKNFVGEILEKEFQFKFWDADEALSPKMLECIKTHTSWTEEMRNNYFDTIKTKLKELQKTYKHVVVAQAFYKDIYREKIIDTFPDALWLHIKAEHSINIARVKERYEQKKSPVDEKYARQIIGFFDPPSTKFTYAIVKNNSDKEKIIKRLKLILGTFYSSFFFNQKAFDLKSMTAPSNDKKPLLRPLLKSLL